MYFCLSSCKGRPGESELMYWLQCDCIKYQDFWIFAMSSPFWIMVSKIFLFRKTMSLILIVRSSSLESEFVNIILGRMHIGGITRWSIMKLFTSVQPPTFTKINCYLGMLLIILRAYQGFNSNVKSSPFLSDDYRVPLLTLFSKISLFLHSRASTAWRALPQFSR